MIGKTAIIGGSGFIGGRLAKRLNDKGKEFIIVDINKSKDFPDKWVFADVRDIPSLLSALVNITDIYNLAAEHKDNVVPRSLYDEVNIKGAINVCSVAEKCGIERIIFTSSVAVYGFSEKEVNEEGIYKPFNDYGRSKRAAELVYEEWAKKSNNRGLYIVRPTAVFGEGNRGNIYNLLKQVTDGSFSMVGSGKNKKSIAYVENVAAFLEHILDYHKPGTHIWNYADKPDFSMNDLIQKISKIMGKQEKIKVRIPYYIGLSVGYLFDISRLFLTKDFSISAARVKKFCANTIYSAIKLKETGFKPIVSLEEGLKRTIQKEFL